MEIWVVAMISYIVKISITSSNDLELVINRDLNELVFNKRRLILILWSPL